MKKVTFSAGGKKYSLKFTTAAQVAYEEHMGEGFMGIGDRLTFDDPAELRIGFVVDLIGFGLEAEHPDLSRADVFDALDAAGGVASILPKLGEALRAALPVAEKAPDEGEAGNATAPVELSEPA